MALEEFNWTKVQWKCQNSQFGEFFEKYVACGQTVLPDRSIVNWTKVDGKCQNGQFLQRNQNSESFRLKKIRQDYQNRNKITLAPSSHFWDFLAPETP